MGRIFDDLYKACRDFIEVRRVFVNAAWREQPGQMRDYDVAQMRAFDMAQKALLEARQPLRDCLKSGNPIDPPAKISQVLECLGHNNYRVGQNIQSVEDCEDAVLAAFFARAAKDPQWVALDKTSLIRLSGYETAPRILKNMRGKYNGLFAKVIDCPGKKGQGGLKIYAMARQKPRKT